MRRMIDWLISTYQLVKIIRLVDCKRIEITKHSLQNNMLFLLLSNKKLNKTKLNKQKYEFMIYSLHYPNSSVYFTKTFPAT